ncbi:hypothetical protein [Chryseobacterium sp.]|uniref:hypothetical protein n=1 Tax=Chryseobacterium sp. TaxID=1871047 RepID=UPI00389009EB
MKKFYKSKSLLKLSFLFAILFSVVSVLNSCKDDEEDEFTDHLVRFEVKATTGVELKTIVTQVGTAQNTMYNTAVTPYVAPWSSDEFFVNSSQSQLNLDANAQMPNSDSELTVTIYVDGEVAKTKTVIGSGIKSVSLDFSFLEL